MGIFVQRWRCLWAHFQRCHEGWSAQWTPDPRRPRLGRWSSRGCLMHAVGLLVLVGVWGHSGVAKGMFGVNRSERKCVSADAGFFHWTMRRKCTFEWFLDSGFQILSARGLSNKTHNETIVKGAAVPRGVEEKWDPLRFYPTGYTRDVTMTCHVFKSHLSTGWCHKLSPLMKARVRVWPPARAAVKTIHLESTHEKNEL